MNMIHAVAYAPSGETLAVAAELGLKLWDPADGKELATLLGYSIDERKGGAEVTSVAFSPDGKLLAVSRSPSKVEFWDMQTGRPMRELESGGDANVAFSMDGARLATAEHHNRVHLWNVEDGKQLAEVHAMMGPLYGVAVHPEGKLLAAVGEGGEKLWRIERDEAGVWAFTDEVRLTTRVLSAVRHVAFSPDGRWLATAGDDGALVVYDAQTQQAAGTLLVGGPFAFSPDGKSLAVAQQLAQEVPGAPGGGTRYGGTRLNIWRLAELLDPDRLAEQARSAAMEMAQILGAPRPDRRKIQGVATVLSGPQGEAASAILVDALKNPLVKEKQMLLFPLSRIAARDAAARTALIDTLRTSQSVDMRTMAAWVLAQLPADVAKEATPALREAAENDESPQVRSVASGALAKLDPEAHREATEAVRERAPVEDRVENRDGKFFYQGRSLEEWIERLSVSYVPNEIFGRPNPREPLAAIRAIGPDAVPVLIENLNADQWTTRRAAAAGLEALAPQAASAVEPLLDVLTAADDKHLHVTGAAADALGVILDKANDLPARLLELTRSDNAAARLSAARAVAVMAPTHPRGLPVLQAAFTTASPRVRMPLMKVGPIPEGPSVGWLGRVIADEEAPLMVRIQAAETLGRLGEAALPAMPEMLQAVAAEDRNVSQPAALAIQKVGPKAVPAVSEALAAAKDDATRRRLATILWGLGEAGRSKFNELVSGRESEPFWWAAVVGTWDESTAMAYQTAVREALVRTGQPIRAEQRDLGSNRASRFPPMYQPPSTRWSMKLLADAESPRSMRMQAATALYVVKPEELRPFVPALLNALAREEDRSLVSQLANVVQRAGPDAIPAVKAAIEQAQSDFARRELLRALSSLGREGRQEFARSMQLNPEYSRLFKTSRPGEEAKPTPDRSRTLTPLERQALAEADRKNRPLTNGDFSAGLEGWNAEGGATSFRTFRRGDGSALTTFGEHQDADTGRLFQCFRVPDDAKYLTFKLHGGANRDKTYVALWRKDYRHARYTARNDNTPFGIQVDLKLLRGEVVTLEIVDHSATGWGFIGAEDFQIVRETE